MSGAIEGPALRPLRALVPLMLVVAQLSLGCGKPDVVGEWELIAPDTGLALGAVLTLSGDGTWEEAGFPGLSGSYAWQDEELVLRIETVGVVTREEAARSVQGNQQARKDHERSMKRLDSQMVLVLDELDGAQILRQSDPDAGFAERRYRKRGS